MTGGEGLLEMARVGVGGALTLAGAAALVLGAVAQLRFRDLYARAHGVALADAIGAAMLCVGLAVLTWEGAAALRLLLLGIASVALTPLVTHAAVGAAHAGGLDVDPGAKPRGKGPAP